MTRIHIVKGWLPCDILMQRILCTTLLSLMRDAKTMLHIFSLKPCKLGIIFPTSPKDLGEIKNK